MSGISSCLPLQTAFLLTGITLSDYGALNALHKKHWIARYGSDGIRKKEYLITPLGKEIAEAEIKRLREVLAIANQMMEGAFSCVKK